MNRSQSYPHIEVDLAGGASSSYSPISTLPEAIALATVRASRYQVPVTILQTDDAWSPAFVLRTVRP